MPLNTSGPISLGGSTLGQSIALQLDLVPTGTISLNDVAVRTLAEVPTGAITMPDNFYGKPAIFNPTISTSQQQLNLRTWALANGWDGTSQATITVNNGVYIWSDNTSVAGLTIDGSWPNGVTLINNGFIMGKGGTGGGGTGTFTIVLPTAGGPAISLGANVTITNNSFIAGGGGGGGSTPPAGGAVGSGGGGGAGGGNSGNFIVPAAIGGSIGNPGANGSATSVVDPNTASSGGAGGRILPGVGGAGVISSTAGAAAGLGGGAGGGGSTARNQIGLCSTFPTVPRVGIFLGGGGGGWGATGGTAKGGSPCGFGPTGLSSGAGGSANNVGDDALFAGAFTYAGAVGGNAVQLNGFSVTWNAFGTRYGAVS